MGEAVGEPVVGLVVGATVVGAAVGALVGLAVGLTVGFPVGSEVIQSYRRTVLVALVGPKMQSLTVSHKHIILVGSFFQLTAFLLRQPGSARAAATHVSGLLS